MCFAVPYDHKYPLCTLVSKSNVMLAQPLRLKIYFSLIFTWKSLSGDRRFYMYDRKRNLRTVLDGLTHVKKLNLLCIVYCVHYANMSMYNAQIFEGCKRLSS